MAIIRSTVNERKGSIGWTFVDKNGKTLSKINSLRVRNFSDGLAMVQCGTRCGYINKAGEYQISPMFEDAKDFSEGLAPVKIGDHWGYINLDGRMLISPRFDDALQFSEGRAGVRLRNRLGFIDRTGNVVIPPIYDEIAPFKQGIGLGFTGDISTSIDFLKGAASQRPTIREDYIDPKGKVLHTCLCSPAGISGLGGTQIHSISKQSYEIIGGLIGHSYSPQDNDFFENTSFSDGLALIQVGSKYGYIDKSFSISIQPTFDFGCRFSEGCAVVYKQGKFGYIDGAGNQLTPFKYSYASSMTNGLACVREDASNPVSSYGYIDKRGQYRIWPVFPFARPFSDGMAHVGEFLQMP